MEKACRSAFSVKPLPNRIEPLHLELVLILARIAIPVLDCADASVVVEFAPPATPVTHNLLKQFAQYCLLEKVDRTLLVPTGRVGANSCGKLIIVQNGLIKTQLPPLNFCCRCRCCLCRHHHHRRCHFFRHSSYF